MFAYVIKPETNNVAIKSNSIGMPFTQLRC